MLSIFNYPMLVPIMINDPLHETLDFFIMLHSTNYNIDNVYNTANVVCVLKKASNFCTRAMIMFLSVLLKHASPSYSVLCAIFTLTSRTKVVMHKMP